MLEASTSSWGFWQAKAEFPLKQCHFKLPRWCLAQPPSGGTSPPATPDGAAQRQQEPVAGQHQ